MSQKRHVKEILPGLFQIKLPIPVRSLESVFAYFAVDGRRNLLIDTGWPGEESQEALEKALSSIGFSFKDIEIVVVSHLHPDHFGLAEEIREANPSSKLAMHKSDASWILNTREEYELFVKELHNWLGQNGTPRDELEAMYVASVKMLNFFRPPKPNVTFEGGEMINVGEKWRFQVIHTPGHTIGNICLYERSGSKVFFSGDHILPTITPNVSLSPRYDGNPLGDYLASLNSLKALSTSLILPSHEYIFSDFKKRIMEIEEHHRARLEECVELFRGKSKSAYHIAQRLHWNSGSWQSLGAWERRAALMETMAHLRYLASKNQLYEVREQNSAILFCPKK